MKVEKITNKYTLQKDGDGYILFLGQIVRGEDTTTKFKVSEVEASKFSVVSTCGCSTAVSNKISATEVEVEVKYNNCDNTFNKTIKLLEDKKITLLKINGSCK